MSRRVLPILLAIFACSSGPAQPSAPADAEGGPPIAARRLVLAVSSYSGDDLARGMALLVAYLENALGIDVELRIEEPYRTLPRLVRAGEVDVAQLPPLAYVRLALDVPGLIPVATPIIGGSPTYLGHLYVRADGPLESLADLRGRRIGYVRDSGSGHLFPRALLRQKGFDPDQFFGAAMLFDSHPQVLAALRAGEVDGAASFDMTTDWTGTLQRPEDLRVVAKTERIPNDLLVARPDFDPGTVDALRRALLGIRPGAPGADAVLAALRMNGWVRAEAARYERVRELLARDARGLGPEER